MRQLGSPPTRLPWSTRRKLLVGAALASIALPLALFLYEYARYRRFAGTDLAAAVPREAAAALRIRGLARRWPELVRSPAATFLRGLLDEARLRGLDVPAAVSCALDPDRSRDDLLPGSEHLTLGRCLDAAGDDLVVALAPRADGTRWCAAMRLPFLHFAAADLGGGQAGLGDPVTVLGEKGFQLQAGDQTVTIVPAGGLLVAANDAAFAGEALRGLTGAAGPADPERTGYLGGDALVCGWIDVASLPRNGAGERVWIETLSTIPLREATHVIHPEGLRLVAWQADLGGRALTVDATFAHASLPARLKAAYALPVAPATAPGFFPTRTAWLGLSRLEAAGAWETLSGWVRERARPGAPEAAADVMRAAYAEVEPVLADLERRGLRARLVAGLGEEYAVGVWPAVASAPGDRGAGRAAVVALVAQAHASEAVAAALDQALAGLGSSPNDPIALECRPCGEATVRVLSSGAKRWEESLSPCYTVARGHVLIASSFEGMRTLLAAGDADRLARAQRFAQSVEDVGGAGTLFHYVDADALRALVRGLAGPLGTLFSDRMDRRAVRVRLEPKERAAAQKGGLPQDDAAFQDRLDQAVLREVVAEEGRIRLAIERLADRLKPLDRGAFTVLPDPEGPAVHAVFHFHSQ